VDQFAAAISVSNQCHAFSVTFLFSSNASFSCFLAIIVHCLICYGYLSNFSLKMCAISYLLLCKKWTSHGKCRAN